MGKVYEGELSAAEKSFAIVVSRFNAFISERLVEGAIDCLKRHGALEEFIDIIRVPGAYELPAAMGRVIALDKYDGVIALGAIIRGSTPHFDYVAAEAAKGIAAIAQNAPCAVAFGVLTCDTIEQAIERAGAKAGNKGADAALTAIEMANLFGALAQ
ncbi:6,7-dimethyl-8-ribityllumazine synthase [Planctomycetales bacterium]|nr:6,7-dimethyl-8-ribityllumazine synthase [Planctomycetales bacterium]GHT06440.1 6,7-dimethyl-8-ribityllumazine synthase [Planctomycetales bacterium]GHV19254.1 6,7-dimethyl-8-ribityllumazine synthase [Planctomycetales bacterium]